MDLRQPTSVGISRHGHDHVHGHGHRYRNVNGDDHPRGHGHRQGHAHAHSHGDDHRHQRGPLRHFRGLRAELDRLGISWPAISRSGLPHFRIPRLGLPHFVPPRLSMPRLPTPRAGFPRPAFARFGSAHPGRGWISFATLLAHWPATVFLIALLASLDSDPGRLTAVAFASALIFGSWALQMALQVVIVNLFPWWEAAIAATGVTAIVWLQLWLALPGMGFVHEMVGDPRLHAGSLAMALVLLPVASAFMVRFLWHVGVARVVEDLGQAEFEAWAAEHARVAGWYAPDGRRRVVRRHIDRAAHWRPYTAGAVLVVALGALTGLWHPAAQLVMGVCFFAAPWVYRRLAVRAAADGDGGPGAGTGA